VLLQLHGYFDTHTAWLYKSNLLLHIERLPFVVVLPGGGNYFWCNYGPRAQFETFLMDDLWNHVQRTYQVRQGARWAIGGLSMGGYGALRLGLKYPERFFSVFAHSSVIPAAGDRLDIDANQSPEIQGDLDCFALASQLASAQLPRFSFDCGVDDELIGHNRRFHQHLETLHLPHHYTENPGAHTWDYWNKHVQTALRQHLEEAQSELSTRL
jgi:S-formylglutathione hydrolase FrmB